MPQPKQKKAHAQKRSTIRQNKKSILQYGKRRSALPKNAKPQFRGGFRK